MASIKTSLILALLTFTAFSYWTVPLRQSEVKATTDNHPHDWIYTAEVAYGEEEKKLHTLFDTTTANNFILTSTCATCPKPTDHNLYVCDTSCKKVESVPQLAEFSVQGGRTKLDQSFLWNEKCIIAGEKYRTINFDVPTSVKAGSDTKEFESSVQSGFGLGYQKETEDAKKFNLPNIASHTQHFKENGFSFFFNKDTHQVIFGERQSFFGTGAKHDFKNIGAEKNRWELKLTEMGVAHNYKLNIGNDKTVVFDSTTRYIHADTAVIAQLVTQFQTFGVQSSIDQSSTEELSTYCENDKTIEKFPSIFFKFEDNKEPFELKNKDYMYYHKATNKCYLLFKKNAGAFSADNAKVISLGTVFTEKYYTYFDQTHNTIQLAQAFTFVSQPQHLSKATLITIIVLGVLLILAALAALLFLLKKVVVPEAAPQKLVEQAPVFSSPQPTYIMAPQIQSQIVRSPLTVSGFQPAFQSVTYPTQFQQPFRGFQ